MSHTIQIQTDKHDKTIYSFESYYRTITETDIVNFVNLFGFHSPPFADMEWVRTTMPGEHNKRFAPGPFLISIATGLVASRLMEVVTLLAKHENLGPFHGGVGINATMKSPVFPGDTLRAELEAAVDRKTDDGRTLVNLKHTLKNQADEVVLILTEKIIFAHSSVHIN